MISKEQLCDKIRSIYPEIGQCGMDVELEWDDAKKAWIVDLRKDGKELTTHLEPQDAEACMLGTRCVALGMQIAQLQANLERRI